jgi:hypothetical protein
VEALLEAGDTKDTVVRTRTTLIDSRAGCEAIKGITEIGNLAFLPLTLVKTALSG